MWNKTGKLTSVEFFLSLVFCLFYAVSAIPVQSIPVQSPPVAVSLNSHQWQSLVRDAIQFLQNHQKNQQRPESVDQKSKIR